ncbi:hypothetical protein BARVI_06415 [Barnesiella viscericola DSM 18177]|uniref:Uncharacterized protein n=1 Tax=Barnesiella viscericola DSM 18177 TaxID=880074 RepID=W0EX61_9BACT|nr:hypothetical protein BARVI_06415 [Barnesiella viscericola DSM 18177]
MVYALLGLVQRYAKSSEEATALKFFHLIFQK